MEEEKRASDELVLLPLIQKDATHPCFNCARCCTYVAVEIDGPTTPREYDYIVWYLSHPDVSVFVDWNGDWFVKFETRCRNLTAQGLCAIYETRPVLCRDFDWRDCEMHVPEGPTDKWLFEDAESFLAWLEKQRPKAFQRFRAWRREKARKKADPALRRLSRVAPPAAAR
jgi:Fe-S-cluster containining protein